MKKENVVEKRFREWCISRGWKCRKLVDLGEPGYPDRTIEFGDGLKCHIEFKRTKSSVVRKSQIRCIRDMLARGERVLITHDLVEAQQWTELMFQEFAQGVSSTIHTNTKKLLSSSST